MHVLSLTILSCFVFWGFNSTGCRSKIVPGNEQEPRLAGKSSDGEYRSLEDFRGKIVLVNVWASWCKPCIEELPALNTIHRERRQLQQRFSVVGINVDVPSAQVEVQNIVKRFDLQFPVILDPGSSFPRQINAAAYPTSLLLDAHGKVLWRRNGMISAQDPELAREIDQALIKLDRKHLKTPQDPITQN